jgi:hypothetical protein
MSKMNTKHRYVYDAAPATLFRARTAGALTATGNTNEVVLDKLDGYWNVQGELADETLAVIVNVTDVETGAADEVYTFALKATDGAGSVQAEAVLGSLEINAVGQYVFLVDAATVKQVADFGGLTITATLAGIAPSITFHSWMSQIKAA